MGMIQELHDQIVEENNSLNDFVDEIMFYCKHGNIFYRKDEDFVSVYVKVHDIKNFSKRIGAYDRGIGMSKMLNDVNMFFTRNRKNTIPIPEINIYVFNDIKGNKYNISLNKLIEFGAIEE